MVGEFLAWAPWWLLLVLGYFVGDVAYAACYTCLSRMKEMKADGWVVGTAGAIRMIWRTVRVVSYFVIGVGLWLSGLLKLIGVV